MRQESHRIHWQQWGKDPQSKRDLITRSAAVRLTDAATARDVVQLLGENLELTGNGALILVGTLYGMPPITYQLLEDSEGASIFEDPFHVVRTLHDDENPLQVRDLMQQALEKKRKEIPQLKEPPSIIAPKLQWYFIPDDQASQILKSIELDGYTTTLDDEEFDDEEDDDEDDGHGHVEPEYPDPLDMPWRVKDVEPKSSLSLEAHKQLQRSPQLAQHHNTADHFIQSGILWKQSRIDPHVWRRVHCVVTEDHFWFVARVKKRPKSLADAAYYGRIGLSRALVVEPSPTSQVTSALLSRIPYSWELVTASGRSHFFRTVSSPMHERWTGCLKARIVQCQENKLLHQAELIVADETKARTKRLVRLVDGSSASNADLIKWTFLVYEYREQCRHIQHRLPSKTLVVASSPSLPVSEDSSSSTELPELDSALRGAIRAVWDLAASLLLQATTKLMRARGRNAETLCRHIDYVLTGRMRLISEAGTPADDVLVNKSRDPPPSDLFDALLAEFQRKTTVN